MSSNVDLNALRQRVLGNQNAGEPRPTDPDKTIVVDSEGRIRLGDDNRNAAGPQTVIPQETFAARIDEDRKIAYSFLPSNTVELTTKEGIHGFVYSLDTEYGDRYTLFAYFDGSNYQVQVVSPEVEERFNSQHTGHVFKNGRICFGNNYGCGMPSLREAFAKSALWANGMSVATRTGQFPFSNNN